MRHFSRSEKSIWQSGSHTLTKKTISFWN